LFGDAATSVAVAIRRAVRVESARPVIALPDPFRTGAGKRTGWAPDL